MCTRHPQNMQVRNFITYQPVSNRKRKTCHQAVTRSCRNQSIFRSGNFAGVRQRIPCQVLSGCRRLFNEAWQWVNACGDRRKTIIAPLKAVMKTSNPNPSQFSARCSLRLLPSRSVTVLDASSSTSLESAPMAGSFTVLCPTTSRRS
jgi:predicted Fe-S protein YdhL (DUF1289 family)